MLYENNLIVSGERPNLFDSFPLPEEEEKIDSEDEIDIKVLTPIRKKKNDFKDIFDKDFKKMFPVPEIKNPLPDYNDEEEINVRVKKLVSSSLNVDYTNEDERVIEGCKDLFEIKYKIINEKYPDYELKFQREKNLNNTHKNYYAVIKSIYAHMNIGQMRLGYLLSMFVIEICCIKFLGLPMAGFTKMEAKRMYKYTMLMIELGESMYPEEGEGEKQSIEWRIGSSFLWNIVIFLSIKLIADYFGANDMKEMLRTVIDQLLENNINVENIETGEAKNINKDENNLFEKMFNIGEDGGSDIGDFLSNIGSNFTQNMENNRKGPTSRNKKVFFNE